MECFLDTNAFGLLLSGVNKGKIPPATLSLALLSPVTAYEAAREKLSILRQHSGQLRPLRHRVIGNWDWFDSFIRCMQKDDPDLFRAQLDLLHTGFVMYQPFLDLHLSRYRRNPPKTIAGSARYTSDVRDTMQLLFSQDVPFITCDQDLTRKLPPRMPCKVYPTGQTLDCVLWTISIINADRLTADKW